MFVNTIHYKTISIKRNCNQNHKRLARPLCKDDMQIREAFHIFKRLFSAAICK